MKYEIQRVSVNGVLDITRHQFATEPQAIKHAVWMRTKHYNLYPEVSLYDDEGREIDLPKHRSFKIIALIVALGILTWVMI